MKRLQPAIRAVLAAFLLLLLFAATACGPPPEPVDLDAAERTGFSQFGEEGVLEKIFELIPPSARYAVEFGAHDGLRNSNTRSLIIKHGWGSLQIEGGPVRAARLKQLYADLPNVTAMESWVFPGNIETLFERARVPQDLDLLVIDIDSNDYWVWRAIHDYRPKVVVIEANHSFPPPQRAVIEFHPMNYWDRTNYIGASIQSLADLGKKKGYELIHVMRTGPNIVFVAEEYFERFGIADNSATALWRTTQKTPENPTEYEPEQQALKVDAFTIPKKWILD